jgi:protein-tyrosine phosphatase
LAKDQSVIDKERVDKFYMKMQQHNTGSFLDAFNLVYDNIYVGGTPNIELGTYPAVDAVLNLRAESQLTLNCKATLWMPVWDREPFPGLDWLATAVEFLESNQSRNWTTYIHCNLGVSRSGMVAIAFLMKKEKIKMEDAWAIINQKRPTWPNPFFCLGLIEWERYLNG